MYVCSKIKKKKKKKTESKNTSTCREITSLIKKFLFFLVILQYWVKARIFTIFIEKHPRVAAKIPMFSYVFFGNFSISV